MLASMASTTAALAMKSLAIGPRASVSVTQIADAKTAASASETPISLGTVSPRPAPMYLPVAAHSAAPRPVNAM